jgi:hypothetical protein
MPTAHYLFSRNKKCGSKLISWSSKLFTSHVKNVDPLKIPSHVAVLIDETYVIESTLTTGVRIIPYNKWKLINEELYKIPKAGKGECHKCLLFEVWGKKYDWFGIGYFMYQITKHLLFKTELPNKNKWERENYFFCTEFAARLEGYNYSMTTPAKMCNDLLEGVK